MVKLKSYSVSIAAILVLAFLYLPLVVVIWYSFNESSIISFPIKEYSLKWYVKMWNNDSLMDAVKNSILVALSSAFIALLIGLPAAFAIYKFKFPGKALLEKIILTPITLPGIITGVAMLSFFPVMGINLSLTAVTIGHITFLIAIMVTQLLGRFKRLDPFLEQAAYDLGATPLRAFFSVIIPNIQTAIIGATLLSLVLSMDEIPVTFFLLARENTLPIELFGMMRRAVTPEINAISTLVFLFSSLLILISLRFTKEIETQKR
jgi:spermidine/putrescine transport system permease protein